jgi:hypothetical protein
MGVQDSSQGGMRDKACELKAVMDRTPCAPFQALTNQSSTSATTRVRTWKERIFGIGPEDLKIGQAESKLINPLSPFSIGWTIATAILLAYTALVTPAQISFGWLDPQCTPTPTV